MLVTQEVLEQLRNKEFSNVSFGPIQNNQEDNYLWRGAVAWLVWKDQTYDIRVFVNERNYDLRIQSEKIYKKLLRELVLKNVFHLHNSCMNLTKPLDQ